MWQIDLHEWRARWRDATHAVLNTCLGAVFVAMAVATIQYEENIAPNLDRLSQGWSSVTADISKRFVEQA
jgi:hypothetical protein